jgi:hypothetical protein
MIKLKHEGSNETFTPMLWKSPLFLFLCQFWYFMSQFFFKKKEAKTQFLKSNVNLMLEHIITY